MDLYALRRSLLQGELWADNPERLPVKFKGGVWIFPALQASQFVLRVMVNNFIPRETKGITLLSFSWEDQGLLASLWPPGRESAEYVVPLVTLSEIEHGELLGDRTLRRMILTQTKFRRPDINSP